MRKERTPTLLQCSILVILPATLACGGLAPTPDVEEEPDVVLRAWNTSPGPGEPDIVLQLILDDRLAVLADGAHRGELAIPAIPEARRDALNVLVTDRDIDGDGLNDLGVTDDDASGTINTVHAWFRYDHSSSTYARCIELDGLTNLIEIDGGLLESTNLGNGVGSSGTATFLKPEGGCSFTPIAELKWDVSLGSGNGTASCTIWGESEPQWRQPVRQRPDRPCPEPVDTDVPDTDAPPEALPE